MGAPKREVAPEVVTFTDDCHSKLTIEITLPGAKKEDIRFTLHNDSMYLLAPGDACEYVATLSFCCPVNPQTVKSSYEKEVLRLVVDLVDPLECAVPVDLN
ncbi:MAG: Hsp20/alpha crystallin family protein [Anaerolineae bacterium]